MQTLEKNSTQKVLHFLLDWAAVIALVLCLLVVIGACVAILCLI